MPNKPTPNKANALLDKIRAQIEELPPEKKRILVATVIVGFGLLVGGLGYKLTRSGATSVQEQQVERLEDISLDKGLLKRSQLADSRRKLEKLTQELEDLKNKKGPQKIVERIIVSDGPNVAAVTTNVKGPDGDKADPLHIPTADEFLQNKKKKAGMPVPEPSAQVGARGAHFPPTYNEVDPRQKAAHENLRPVVVGGISIVSNTEGHSEQNAKQEEEADKKKASNEIYLPTSFVEATLLSGLDAPTSGAGSGNPVPVLMRIRDLAILPNDIKANLKGCFVIGEGVGDLAKERADIRLVSLSCISKKGQAVIDQSIKGFVVDSDGKVGLSGRIVSKMGSTIARAALAGLFGGVGEAFQSSSTTDTISALGATSVVDSDQMKQAALGGGLKAAADEIQKYYLDLAKQTIPVIEIGATKTVTLVFSQGAKLEIKEFDRIGG